MDLRRPRRTPCRCSRPTCRRSAARSRTSTTGRIDGEEAAGVLLTRDNDAGISVEQRAYIVRNGDDAVVITSSHKAGDEGPLDKYEEIYDSWSWE